MQNLMFIQYEIFITIIDEWYLIIIFQCIKYYLLIFIDKNVPNFGDL